MQRMRPVERWILSLLVCWAMSAGFLSALDCNSNINGVIGVGTVNSATGIRTIKVALPPVGNGSSQTTQGTRDAAEAAVDAWNAKTSLTKIHFEKVSSGGDISIERNPTAVSNAGGFCAAAGPGTNVAFDDYISSLGQNPNGTTGNRTNSAILTRIFSHELGHVMNLAQAGTTDDSIMAGASGGSNCQDAVTNHPATHSDSGIKDSDATKANECANKGGRVKDPDEGYGASQPDGDCWAVYWVTIWYTEDDYGSWNVVDAEWDLLYTTCDNPPY